MSIIEFFDDKINGVFSTFDRILIKDILKHLEKQGSNKRAYEKLKK